MQPAPASSLSAHRQALCRRQRAGGIGHTLNVEPVVAAVVRRNLVLHPGCGLLHAGGVQLGWRGAQGDRHWGGRGVAAAGVVGAGVAAAAAAGSWGELGADWGLASDRDHLEVW